MKKRERSGLRAFCALAAVFVLSAEGGFTAFGGQWQRNERGWWWQEEDGSCPKNWSRWLDGNGDGLYELYYFDGEGYLYTDCLLFDGMVEVGADGACLVDGRVWQRDFDPEAGMKKAGGPEGGVLPEAGESAGGGELPKAGESAGGGAALADEPEEAAREVAQRINEERVRAGRTELAVNDVLMEDAALRAREQAERSGHKRPDGSSYMTAVSLSNHGAGENTTVLRGIDPQSSDAATAAARIAASWLDSERHRENLLRDCYRQTGVGIYFDEEAIYAVQLFVIP